MTDHISPRRKSGNLPNLADLITRYWLVALVSVPVFRVIFLTSTDGNFAQWQTSARLFFLPTLFLEIGIFILAVMNGLNVFKSSEQLSRSAKLALLGWFIVLCGAAILSDAMPALGVRGAFFWITHILFFAGAAHLMSRNQTNTANSEIFLIILPIASSVVGLFMLCFVYLIGMNSGFNWGEHMPGYGNLRHTGYIFAPAIALSLGHLAARPSQSAHIHIGLLIINSSIMLWLGSRGPVFGILLGLGVCTLCFYQMRQALFWFRSSIAMASSAILSLLLPIPKDSEFGTLQRLWDSSIGQASVTSGRADLWAETIDLIYQKPFFGYGAHNFQFVSEHANGMLKHPHQSVLQFLFDWGVIGGGLFLFLFGLIVFRAFYASQSASYIKLISAMVISTMLAFSLVDGIYFYPYTIAISIIFLLWPIIDGRKNEPETPS